jgi:hypothetical protein
VLSLGRHGFSGPHPLSIAGRRTRVRTIGLRDIGWLSQLRRDPDTTPSGVLDTLLHRLARGLAGGGWLRREIDELALADKKRLLAAIVARNDAIAGVPVCGGGPTGLLAAIRRVTTRDALEAVAASFIDDYLRADGLVGDAALTGLRAAGA